MLPLYSLLTLSWNVMEVDYTLFSLPELFYHCQSEEGRQMARFRHHLQKILFLQSFLFMFNFGLLVSIILRETLSNEQGKHSFA